MYNLRDSKGQDYPDIKGTFERAVKAAERILRKDRTLRYVNITNNYSEEIHTTIRRDLSSMPSFRDDNGTVVYAEFQIGGFTFRALGADLDEAWCALKRGWLRHCKTSRAHPDVLKYWDVNFLAMAPGHVFRDWDGV